MNVKNFLLVLPMLILFFGQGGNAGIKLSDCVGVYQGLSYWSLASVTLSIEKLPGEKIKMMATYRNKTIEGTFKDLEYSAGNLILEEENSYYEWKLKIGSNKMLSSLSVNEVGWYNERENWFYGHSFRKASTESTATNHLGTTTSCFFNW